TFVAAVKLARLAKRGKSSGFDRRARLRVARCGNRHISSEDVTKMKHVEHIMVVEDDPDISDMVCALLRSQGYEPDCVFNGADAVERIVEKRPDAVVLDVMLPGMNGFDVCRKLKFRKDTNS